MQTVNKETYKCCIKHLLVTRTTGYKHESVKKCYVLKISESGYVHKETITSPDTSLTCTDINFCLLSTFFKAGRILMETGLQNVPPNFNGLKLHIVEN
jgi:hypothetical protein